MSDMVSQLFRAQSHLAGTSEPSLWLCLIVTLAFAIVAFLARAVSFSGGVAGIVVCFLLCAGAGLPALAPLLAVFAMAWLGTKVGYQEKVKIGTAEKIEGRNAFQVLANLSVAAICATLYSVTGKAAFLVAMAASLSEAAADTVSSEVGQLSKEKARLISTWEAVPAGTDGAITALGTVSGIAAAMAVSVLMSVERQFRDQIVQFANGDIASAQHARKILAATGCDGVMIGRAAQGRPWIFDEVNFFLETGEIRAVLALEKVRDIMRAHLEDLYAFYGDQTGVRVARKHLSWYFRQHPGQEDLRNLLVQIETPEEQLSTLLQHYDTGVERAA